MKSFVHLHTHTEFSMLDGAARIKEAVAKAKADLQPALAITDHGNMYGVLDFYKECRSQGINPIIGIEAYMSGGSRFDRPARRGKVDDTGGDADGGEKLYYHLILLAENNQGYKNLMKLSSAAYLEGYYYKPRVDFELLDRYHEGVIATTGCLGGLVLQSLLRGDEEQAYKIAGNLQEIFGRDNLFVELQDHGIPEQKRTNPLLIELARKLDAPLLATNDSHYNSREDSVAHDALLCVQTGATLADEKRFKFHGDQHYLKSAAEMRELFSGVEQACDNTLWIAERAQVEIEFGKPKLPEFPVPIEFQSEKSYEESAAEYLRHLTYRGAAVRYGADLREEVKTRLDYELSVISEMGFSAYFLVVWDLIKYAKDNKIRVGPGRGSAAGCCVAYCLGIVDLDPIKYDLLFERFLNPGRIQMPDIDMDFDERYRSDMIRYATERYGWDRVAQIVTFSTIKARAAVRDAARVLGYPYGIGDKIAKAMPPLIMGRDTPLRACLDRVEGYEDGFNMASDLREMCESDSDARRVIEVARGLEGLRRQDGIHAAAVVITHEPLTEYLPIQRKPDPGSPADQAPIVTQYEMHGVEELGLLKMDFLGLRTLSIIERALDLIAETTGVRPDIDSVPLDDDKTLAMLREGDSIGVFQLEGRPMRALMRSLAPTSFDDIAALVALYRPGPMAANMHNDYADRKNARKSIDYIHEDLKDILADTYGLMIYQESVMRVAQKFAGYTLAEADNLRKACGKKIRSLIQAEREKFVEGCQRSGYGEPRGTALFDIIEPFADYAFNKSHSYGYGLIAYQTAWLKANYAVQFLAAILTSVKDDKEKTAVYLSDARDHQIQVMVPDVNVSRSDFTAIPSSEGNGAIRFGLAAVRNVGESVVELIVLERDKNGPFGSFVDYCMRVDPVALNKRSVEALIRSGAFDSLGHPRKGLLAIYETTIDRALTKRKEIEAGIMSLFDSPIDEPDSSPNIEVTIPDVEFEKSELLASEKEMLGLYVSDHPLLGLEKALSRFAEFSISEALELPTTQRGDEMITVGGVATTVSRRYTKRGDLMGNFVLEDLTSSIEVFLFPRQMAEFGAMLEEDAIFVVKGRVDTRDDQAKIVAYSLSRPNLTAGSNQPLGIRIGLTQLTQSNLSRLKSLLSDHHGNVPVRLHIGEDVYQLPIEFRVNDRGGLIGELRVLFGANAIFDSSGITSLSA
ncbi:MAG: DNA polymerase III subunit alpha [Actinomycetota bacterium]|nr:DNA polymerase III subunit alpha [Actinomycetota bacterium]